MPLLTGWKPIANYIGVSVQTAKKWYKTKGLPVCRGPNNIPMSFEELIKEWVLQYDAKRKTKINKLKTKIKDENL